MAQRLVRRLCDHCKNPYQPTPNELRRLGLDELPGGGRFFEAVGCEKCMQTGYKGRSGIYEIMAVDEELRSRIARSEDSRTLGKLAREHGMRTLMEDAAIKVAAGLTTVQEALRAARL